VDSPRRGSPCPSVRLTAEAAPSSLTRRSHTSASSSTSGRGRAGHRLRKNPRPEPDFHGIFCVERTPRPLYKPPPSLLTPFSDVQAAIALTRARFAAASLHRRVEPPA
jgi:hypothetical protein